MLFFLAVLQVFSAPVPSKPETKGNQKVDPEDSIPSDSEKAGQAVQSPQHPQHHPEASGSSGNQPGHSSQPSKDSIEEGTIVKIKPVHLFGWQRVSIQPSDVTST